MATDSGSPPASAAVVDAGPPVPQVLSVALALELADGGVLVAPDATSAPVVGEAARALTVHVPAPLTDYRIRLFDWTDRIVTSDDVATPTDGGIAYRIALAEPLKSGRAYTVLIDPQLGITLSDAAGGAWEEARVRLEIAGDVVAEPAPGKKAPSRRRGKRR